MRKDGRKTDELRPLEIRTDVMKNAHGSALISAGDTQVLCTAMIEPGVPPFLIGSGDGWLTAEYAMLPASTPVRKQRNGVKPDGRGVEIQRLIGRALRSVCDFSKMGEYTIHIDCDVLGADGGTRTASVSGAFVALALCAARAVEEDLLKKSPVEKHIAAVSAGLVDDLPLLDLCYMEDSSAQADMNLVAAEDGGIAEVQISGEKRTVAPEEFAQLMRLCQKGICEIIAVQKEALKNRGIAL